MSKPIDYQKRIAQLCHKYGIQMRHYNGNMRPFCWNVKIYSTPSFQQVFNCMSKNFFHGVGDAVVSTPNLETLRNDWVDRADSLYTVALEDMGRHYLEDAEKGGSFINYVRPRLEHKYKVKAPDDRGWDVKFNFYGRNGGWLSLERFEGIELRTVIASPDHQFMDLEDDEKQTYRRKLCAYLEEVSLMAKREAIEAELRYQLAFQMNLMVEEQQEKRRKK